LSLVGADVRAWYNTMAKPNRLLPQKRPLHSLALPAAAGALGSGGGGSGAAAGALAGGSRNINSFYLSQHCAACDGLTRMNETLCERCRDAPQLSGALLSARAARLERQHLHLVRLCLHCGGGGGGTGAGGGGGGVGRGLVYEIGDGGVACDSLDCGVFFERRKVRQEARVMAALAAGGLALLRSTAAADDDAGGGEGVPGG